MTTRQSDVPVVPDFIDLPDHPKFPELLTHLTYQEFDFSEWGPSAVFRKGTPQQRNGCDCAYIS